MKISGMLACLKRSRTRLAPTPTTISMNSDAAMEKKGTSASPATARASSACGSGLAGQQHAPWYGRPQLRVLARVVEEVDDLHQFVFGFVGTLQGGGGLPPTARSAWRWTRAHQWHRVTGLPFDRS